MKKIDIVIPAYHTGDYIKELLDNLIQLPYPDAMALGNIYLVLDGPEGLDNSLTIDALQEDYPDHLKIITLNKNYGQYTATFIGLISTENDWVVTMDDDFQHTPATILEMLNVAKTEEADLIYANYDQANHKMYKSLGGKLLRRVLKASHPASENASSFRLVHRDIIKNIGDKAILAPFLDENLWHNSRNYQTIKYEHQASLRDSSTYSSYKLFKQAANLILFHTSLPLKWMTRIGLFAGVIFFFIGLYRIYLKLYDNVELGYTSIIVSIFFTTSLLLISLGIIGEYIRRIWLDQQQLNRVNYRIHHAKK